MLDVGVMANIDPLDFDDAPSFILSKMPPAKPAVSAKAVPNSTRAASAKTFDFSPEPNAEETEMDFGPSPLS